VSVLKRSKPVGKPVHPFLKQCGLPAGVENAEPSRQSVAARLSGRRCRGGLADELNLGKPPAKPKKK